MTGNRLRVAVVDDQQLLVAAFRSLLDAQADMDVVATAHDGRAALEALRQARNRSEPADVVLMDIRMPVLDGIGATRGLLSDPELSGSGGDRPTRVLMLTTFQEEELVLGALRAGASGFLLKDSGPADLLAAVRAVAAGQAWLDPVVTPYVLRALEGDSAQAVGGATAPAADPGAVPITAPAGAASGARAGAGTGLLPGEALTGRERDVLELVCRGMTNPEIASRLYIAESTVKTHVKALLGHTGCRNRVELVIHALRTEMVRAE
ncbi:DNA-binding response regulator, NarL/FixJ family, contains REC and HTH domains [Actinomyces ruminicola]|uniref:DNA-binding response regulator, NarL/FixJ family, contains REC and HTH domains n=1 Tax=Actinomyces ruminicola TaxID=332524 RepID=A0A1H0FEN7_9ACTO|nr:response regulator transcription factor [Actinomyces ruminicola]SDN93021.1 DNA-binding response regulator, NarL/FixJ family, contains REC and HTH domains [Actinomyces ruminicola]